MENILLTGTRLKLLKDKNWDDNNPEKEAVGLKRVLQRERQERGWGEEGVSYPPGSVTKRKEKKKGFFWLFQQFETSCCPKTFKGTTVQTAG